MRYELQTTVGNRTESFQAESDTLFEIVGDQIDLLQYGGANELTIKIKKVS